MPNMSKLLIIIIFKVRVYLGTALWVNTDRPGASLTIFGDSATGGSFINNPNARGNLIFLMS